MKKLSALILAVLMALTLTVTAFADSAYDLWFVVGSTLDGWQDTKTERVAITKSGEYTFTVTGISYPSDTLALIYLKDAAVESGDASESEFPGGFEVITKSLKINGEEVALKDGYPTSFDGFGTFEIDYFNIWGTSYLTIDGFYDITDVELVVEITYPEGTEPVIEAPAEEAPADEAPAEDTAEEAPAEDAVEEAPAAEPEVEAEEAPAETGLAFAVIPAIIAMAAAVVSKKR